ncbi:MAG TPA: GAF domain-containing protein [Spirochaetes bacterium]|nr:GAF domain-containing protein [Spirochaetota bacterium]
MAEMKNRHFYFFAVVVVLLPLNWVTVSALQAVFKNEFLLKALLSFAPYQIFIKAGFWVLTAAVWVTMYSFVIMKKNSKNRLLNEKQNEMAALLKASRIVLKHKSFKNTARQIYNFCKSIIGATQGYLSLLSKNGAENEYIFIDSGNYPPKEDRSFSVPIRGMLEEAYKTCEPICSNDLKKSKWTEEYPEGQKVDNILISPLVINDSVVGLLVLANKEEGFKEEDSNLAGVFGEIISIALYKSRTLELYEESENQKIEIINELNDAISKIKTLSGLVPICAECKKIRDDKGFWYQVEEYIEKHSNAEFSHGLCPECIKKMHPDIYHDLFLNDKSD